MSNLLEMSRKFPCTHYWNDSCSKKELAYALERGACGATTNPVIVKQVLERELDSYAGYITELIATYPQESEDRIAWRLIEHMAVEGAEMLLPVFDPALGKGRLSIQTNTKYYNNAALLAEQAVHFNSLAPNIQVKIPCTAAGLEAMEEAVFQGVSINATVSFSVPQALAVAERVEAALARRREAGLDNSALNPVCTIMVGRLDDWLKYVVERDRLSVDPDALNYAGIACAKKAYGIYKEKGWRTRLLIAAFRLPQHWAEFIGGDISLTIPHKYQTEFNNARLTLAAHIDEPVKPAYVDALLTLPDFVKAYNGMPVADFDGYGPVNRTLLQFAEGYDELVRIIRSFMLRY